MFEIKRSFLRGLQWGIDVIEKKKGVIKGDKSMIARVTLQESIFEMVVLYND